MGCRSARLPRIRRQAPCRPFSRAVKGWVGWLPPSA